LGLAAVCLGACKQRILPINTMKQVLWDLARADEYALNFIRTDTTVNLDDRTKELYAKVFKWHGITRQQYLASVDYYMEQPARMKVLLDSLNAYANREREAQFMQATPTPLSPVDSTHPATHEQTDSNSR
ncbi:MAG TPA: DUF4296 domain-containing protein, partial [Phnomibacter sp.]|nr:DUF4296 domain-containing protein [Phnomibacter sp.]